MMDEFESHLFLPSISEELITYIHRVFISSDPAVVELKSRFTSDFGESEIWPILYNFNSRSVILFCPLLVFFRMLEDDLKLSSDEDDNEQVKYI